MTADLADLTEDIIELRRLIVQWDATPPHRITDEPTFVARRQRLVDELHDLERARAELAAAAMAAEGFAA